MFCLGTLRLTVSPEKQSKKSGGKGSVALLKKSKHLGCVFQDTEKPKSRSILRKSTKYLGSDRSVRFSEGTLHFVTIGERKGPSQGVTQKCETQERNRCAPKFEDGTQQETLQQERCALRKAWDLAKNVHKLNDLDKAAFFSPSEVWSLPAPSSKKPEERIRGRFRSINAHAKQERSELS